MNYWTFAEAEHVQRFLDALRAVMWLWAWSEELWSVADANLNTRRPWDP